MDCDIDTLIKRLQSGEKIGCFECKRGVYVTTAEDKLRSREFYCEKCGSVIKISPNIIIE